MMPNKQIEKIKLSLSSLFLKLELDFYITLETLIKMADKDEDSYGWWMMPNKQTETTKTHFS